MARGYGWPDNDWRQARSQILAVHNVSLRAQGLISESFPRAAIVGANSVTSGTLRGSLLGLTVDTIITNVHYMVTSGAATVTLAKVGIYDASGNLLASSASDSSKVTSTGAITFPLSSTWTVTETGGYYAALICTATTPPTLCRGANQANSTLAFGSNPRAAFEQTGQTDLTNPATLADTSIACWFGVS